MKQQYNDLHSEIPLMYYCDWLLAVKKIPIPVRKVHKTELCIWYLATATLIKPRIQRRILCQWGRQQ